MHTYIKGARTERELLNRFYSCGYSVLRSAGSGVSSLCPDIIAIKDGVCLAFECKAWERNRLSIDHEGFEKLRKWKENTKFPTFVAWRMNNVGWYFIELEEMKKGEKDYSITKKRTVEIGRDWDSLGFGLPKLEAFVESKAQPA
jgi:Holliday junction resolvase